MGVWIFSGTAECCVMYHHTLLFYLSKANNSIIISHRTPDDFTGQGC